MRLGPGKRAHNLVRQLQSGMVIAMQKRMHMMLGIIIIWNVSLLSSSLGRGIKLRTIIFKYFGYIKQNKSTNRHPASYSLIYSFCLSTQRAFSTLKIIWNLNYFGRVFDIFLIKIQFLFLMVLFSRLWNCVFLLP